MCISGQPGDGPRYRLTAPASVCISSNDIIAIKQHQYHYRQPACHCHRHRGSHSFLRCRQRQRQRTARALSLIGQRKPLLCHPQIVKIRSITQRKLRAHRLDPSYISRRRPKITVTLSHGPSTISHKIHRRLHSINSRRKQRHKNRQLSNARGPCVRHFPASRLVPRTKTQQRHITRLPISIRQPQQELRRPIIARTQRRRSSPQRQPQRRPRRRPGRTSSSSRHNGPRLSIHASERITVLQLA